MLERPVLFLSSYFKKHKKIYYQKLHDYHFGEVESWVDFFLDGVIKTANDSIAISKQITTLREDDMAKIQDPAIVITNLHLIKKSGGKSDYVYSRQSGNHHGK